METWTTQLPKTSQERSWSPEQGRWTYEDWLQLPDDGYRYEVLDGVLYMTLPPRILHQRVSLRLALKLGNFVEQHNPGEVLATPVSGFEIPVNEVF